MSAFRKPISFGFKFKFEKLFKKIPIGFAKARLYKVTGVLVFVEGFF